MHAPAIRLKRQSTTTDRLRPLAGRLPARRQFVCDRAHCAVSWKGEEADCWNCGQPATSRHLRRGSALQRLLDQAGAAHRPARRRSHRKAGLA